MLVSPDKQSHAILLVSDNFDDIRGHQHPRNIQLEDRFGSGDRLDPRVHVHDQGNRFIREGILLKCSTVSNIARARIERFPFFNNNFINLKCFL